MHIYIHIHICTYVAELRYGFWGDIIPTVVLLLDQTRKPCSEAGGLPVRSAKARLAHVSCPRKHLGRFSHTKSHMCGLPGFPGIDWLDTAVTWQSFDGRAGLEGRACPVVWQLLAWLRHLRLSWMLLAWNLRRRSCASSSCP